MLNLSLRDGTVPYSHPINLEMLEITGDHIAKLSDEDLRTLVVRLCEAELRRFNLPLSAVTAGGHQNAADGGLDVRVELPNDSPNLDFIPKNATGFQVKQQDMPAASIDAEMQPKGKLRPSICELGSKHGAYVIVSGQGSVADFALNNRKTAMQTAIRDLPQGSTLALDFYDRDRIARWVRVYPGVVLWLREHIGEPLAGWRPYGNWAYGDTVDSEYLFDDKCRVVAPQQADGNAPLTVEHGIQAIRAVLRNPHGIVRLVGLSGTGKTRLAQALFDAKVGSEALDRSIVIYVDQGSEQSPTPSARDMVHQLAANGHRAIVVVDNCNPATHRDLAQAVSASGCLVSLITVEYDVSDDEPEETQVFRLEPASEKIIEEILQRLTPSVSQTDRARIAEFSGGNSRIALALARTVDNSGSLATLNDMELFKRLFYQRQGGGETLMKAAEICSLVYSFDGEAIEDEGTELSILAGLAEITPNDLYRHVGELRSRDLVQRRSKWRAVLPHAIANRLARQALEKMHLATLINVFSQHGRERLLKSFSRRLGYLHDSEQAKQIAAAWLTPEGLLGNPAHLNDLGVAMFKNIAPLAPEGVLQAIERSASDSEGKVFLSTENHMRWGWCGLLRSIAYDAQYFNRAALLLARFVAEETESNNHNSGRNSLKELFHIYLSGTHALVETRLDVVRQLIESENRATNICGLEALAAMMENSHFTSSHDFSFGGMHRDFGWEPETGAGVVAWFRSVIAFAKAQVDANSPHSPDIKLILARHFRGLWLHAGICSELEKVVRDFAAQGGWPDGWLAICDTIHFDLKKMHIDFANRTRALEKELRPVNLEQKIRSYVLSNKQGHFDIVDIELNGDSNANYEQTWVRANRLVEDLGVEAASRPDIIAPMLPELLSSCNTMVWQFGRGLAKGVPDIKLAWNQLCNVLATIPDGKCNISLMRGFVEAISARDSNITNQLMDEAVADPVLSPFFPTLQTSYPVDESGAKRLISSIAHGRAQLMAYSCLMYGRVSDTIPLPLFSEILLGLVSLPNGYEIAFDIFRMRVFSLKSDQLEMDCETTELGRELLKLNEFHSANHNHAYHVNEVAIACLVGETAYKDALIICTDLARALVNNRSRAGQYGELGKTLFRLQPMAAIRVFLNDEWVSKSISEMIIRKLKKFVAALKFIFGSNTNKYLRRPLSSSFYLDKESPVNAAPPEILKEWAAENPKVRLPQLAEEIHLFVKNGEHDTLIWSPLALEILELAPDRSVILDVYASHFHPRGGWSGSLADVFAPYLALAEELQSHNDPLVVTWAKKQADFLTKKIAEERKHDRCVDESFE